MRGPRRRLAVKAGHSRPPFPLRRCRARSKSAPSQCMQLLRVNERQTFCVRPRTHGVRTSPGSASACPQNWLRALSRNGWLVSMWTSSPALCLLLQCDRRARLALCLLFQCDRRARLSRQAQAPRTRAAFNLWTLQHRTCRHPRERFGVEVATRPQAFACTSGLK